MEEVARLVQEGGESVNQRFGKACGRLGTAEIQTT